MAAARKKPVQSKAAREAELTAELDRVQRLRDNAALRHDRYEMEASKIQQKILDLTQPIEPDTSSVPPPVVRFRHRPTSSWSSYDYAAIGREGFWYITQDANRRDGGLRKRTWAQLLHFVGEDHWDSIKALK